MRNQPKFAWKHRQANLPDGAYDNLNGLNYYASKEEIKRYCKNHPTSTWGKRSDGEYYQKCIYGFRHNEPCEIGE